ncbi:MAG: hypothetical protein AAGM67_09645, partial [Bacteroidota bacterium]
MRSLYLSCLLTAMMSCRATNVSFAQNPCYEFIPTGKVTDVYYTSSDIWIGTEADGLIQLNNSTYAIEQIYTPSNSSLDSLYIESIHHFRQRIVVSTGKSLFRLGGQFEVLVDSISGLLASGPSWNQLYVVDDRDMYLVEWDSVIYHQDLTQIVPDACCTRNTAALGYLDGLWISHHDFYEFDILHFDGTNWTVYGDHNSILPVESFQHNDLTYAPEGGIFASHWGGIDYFDHQTDQWAPFHRPNSGDIIVGTDTLKNTISAIGMDSWGGIWVGVDPYIDGQVNAKLAYFDSQEWHYLDGFSPDSFTTHVIDITINSKQDAYFGTSEGLLIVNKKCLGLLSSNEALIEAESVQIYPN